MHELSVAQSICESVRERAGGLRIEEMIVEVGALSGVNCESLAFVLPDAAQMCNLDLAGFTIEPVAAQAECECGNVYEARELLEPCPKCGGFERSITGGEDVVVSKLIAAEEDEQAN
ncbi:MAG: hydrogenase maturation nickel metallochaperone HypA [Planctomycetota bacterium]